MGKIMRLSIFLVAMLTSFSTTAWAIDVKKEIVLNAPLSKVWAEIGGWCALKDWHPAVAGCVEKREGENLRRILSLNGGGEIVERLTGEDENSYSYVIESGPLPVDEYKATIMVSAMGETKTKFSWSGNFKAKGKSDAEAASIISGVYDAGIKSLEAKFGK